MSLNSLSTEVLSIIASFLVTSPNRDQRAIRNDLHSLTLSCRRLKDVATPILYRLISVPNGSSATRLFHTLIHNPHIRPLVRELRVHRGTRRTRMDRLDGRSVWPPEPVELIDVPKTDVQGIDPSANGFFEANFEHACRSTFKSLDWHIDEFSADDANVFALGECSALADGSLTWDELDDLGHIQLTSSILVGILCLTPKLDDVRLPVLIDQPYEILEKRIRKARVKGCLRMMSMPQLSSFGTVSEWLSLI